MTELNFFKKIWILLNFVVGGIFLWAFIDKVFGLGYSTPKAQAWLQGVSPTAGFLSHGTHGPFVVLFQHFVNQPVVDWLFMLGLLLVGLCLILGIGLRIAGLSGALMMALIYLSAFPPKTNPILDEHIVYILILIGTTRSAELFSWSLGSWWQNLALIKHYPWLR